MGSRLLWGAAGKVAVNATWRISMTGLNSGGTRLSFLGGELVQKFTAECCYKARMA
jgi:hypothetical protein